MQRRKEKNRKERAVGNHELVTCSLYAIRINNNLLIYKSFLKSLTECCTPSFMVYCTCLLIYFLDLCMYYSYFITYYILLLCIYLLV